LGYVNIYIILYKHFYFPNGITKFINEDTLDKLGTKNPKYPKDNIYKLGFGSIFMEDDDILNIKVRRKDKDDMKKLSCAEFGMKQHEVFNRIISFCLKENERLKKWNNQKNKK